MNEQGTLGNFKIWATPIPVSQVGPGSGINATDMIVAPATNPDNLTGQTENSDHNVLRIR